VTDTNKSLVGGGGGGGGGDLNIKVGLNPQEGKC
jgi:hypothetical protein